MDKTVRDDFATAIDAAKKAGIDVSYGLLQLAKDLKATSTPLRISYGDLTIFHHEFQRMEEQNSLMRTVPTKEMDEKYAIAQPAYEALVEAFESALEKNVLVTQDTARGRINA